VDQISRIGMDTSKHVFQLDGVNAAEEVVLRRTAWCTDQGCMRSNPYPNHGKDSCGILTQGLLTRLLDWAAARLGKSHP